MSRIATGRAAFRFARRLGRASLSFRGLLQYAKQQPCRQSDCSVGGARLDDSCRNCTRNQPGDCFLDQTRDSPIPEPVLRSPLRKSAFTGRIYPPLFTEEQPSLCSRKRMRDMSNLFFSLVSGGNILLAK